MSMTALTGGSPRGLWRVLLAIGLLLSALLGAWTTATGLRIESDASRTIRGGSAAYHDFQEFEARFGTPSEDEVLVVSAATLGTEEALLALEDLVIELQLSGAVRGVLSIFSIPGPDDPGTPLLSRDDIRALDPSDRLAQLRAESETARRFLSEDMGTTLILVLPDLALPEAERVAALNDAIGFVSGRLDVQLLGLTALNREVSAAIASDQAFYVPLGAALCLAVAAILFRTPVAIPVCAVAPALSIAWTLAAMTLLDVAFTPMITVVPVIVITLGIADGVHLYHAFLSRLREGREPEAAIAAAMQEIMPAILVTSGTTAAAFLSLLFVGTETLQTLAWVGALGLMLNFLALALAVPMILSLLHRRDGGTVFVPRFRRAEQGTLAVLSRPGAIRMVAALSLAGLLFAQTYSEPGFEVMHFVPYNSDFRSALDTLEDTLPGSAQSYVTIAGLDGQRAVSAAEAARIDAVAEAVFGTGSGFPLPEGEWRTDNPLAARFVSEDGWGFALPVPGPLSADWTETLRRTAQVEDALSEAGLADVTSVTGYTHMLSVELPLIVAELRVAFYLAVGTITLVMALFLRSLPAALAALIPNIIPILGAEAWLVATGAPLTLIEAVALTIAFGIAVDDTTHVLNRIRLARRVPGTDIETATRQALQETVQPIMTTSLILIAGFAAASFSDLPSMSNFCHLATIATGLALVADLILLPSLVTAFWRRPAPRVAG